MIRALYPAIVLALVAAPALAEDVAFVVGNRSYDEARRIEAGREMVASADAFEAAGFRVFEAADANARDLFRLAADFAAAADGSGRIVIALAGHFAQSASGSWFLATDADAPGLIEAGQQGLPLSTLMEIAARAPGQAVVLLGTEDRRIALGAGLQPGIGPFKAPQGVAVIRGDARAAARFARRALLEPGQSLARALETAPELTGEGFVSQAIPFIAAPSAAAPSQADLRAAEAAAYDAARRADTVAAYEAFLRDWPAGANAARARAALETLRAAAAATPEAVEAALYLGTERRREIQRALTLLDFDTRGIDGIFGPGTRAAIRAWQRTNGADVTGYLTAEQIDRIEAQAARRAEQLEAEAAARQAQIDAADRAYWAETGAKGDEAGLRAYLARYPDGLYADLTKLRLRPYDEARLAEARAVDRAAWDRAQRLDTEAGYREYLATQPDGAFREQAEARLEELQAEAGNEEAARTEAALGLNAFTRNLVESRLDALGLRPGRVDGVFDADTRRAIRRYQQARNLRATGYLDQPTLVRLLADSVIIR